jgi:hypothetical protein
VTGQQPVNVAVGKPAGEAVVAQKESEPAKETAPEAAAPEPQAAAAEPQAVPGQPEPVVPDENAPPTELPKPPVKIGKVDYQDTGADSGKISLSGVGDPDIRVQLFFDEQSLGEVVVGSDGTWVLEVEKKLAEGEHTIRADTFDQKTGMLAGRASVRIGREAAAEAAPPTDVAAAPQDLSRQPQPVYPEAAGEAGQTPEEPAAEVAEAPTGTRPQPQPVYPDGPPADLDAPSSYAEAAPQPQDLSSQPQPVYPPEPAPAETAAAEPAPAEPAAPPPEPAPAEPSQAVTAETPSEAKPAEEPKKAPVVFKSVDYQDTGAESGKVALAGTGEPGMRIFLYADQTPLGEVSIGSDGSWTFEGERKLGTGEHKFRADAIEPETGVALSSASIGIIRTEPPKEEVAAAPEAPTPPPSTEAAPEAAAPQP